ncbi:PREDICTED: uncharacterized protein LOC105314950 [Amphimedon queenslandica]|uniref:Death domain-containing protein n=1 Tax=Amphimedon queenslandica TaxID=400682 RepID=A0AAN0JSX5_AMPQE|nr:PREDICTED: uncharacterized protein LOC105314950 [Amphimedon queenslandica]|eukprot:XP_019859994.1 PREDICTED: uncharacterized protein LOC105314950 [Amphimedon queenslandica]
MTYTITQSELQSEIQKIKNESATFQKQRKALILENERLMSLIKDHNVPVEQKEETEILQETETLLYFPTDNLEGLNESQIAGKKLFLVQGDKPQLMNWEEYGLRISVAEDSLSASETVEVSVLALVGGHFKFPDNTRLVSAVYAISTSPLLKSLRIEMQHCIDLSDPSLSKYLKFAVAPVHTASLPYQFSLIEGGEFPAYQRYGWIERSKFCQLAIVGEEEEGNGGGRNEERNGEEDGESGDEGGKGKGETTGGEGQGAGGQEGGASGGVEVEHQQQKEEDKQVEGQLKQEEKNKQEKEEHDNGGREGQKLLLVKESEQHIEELSQVAVGTESVELSSQSTIVVSTHSTGIPEATVYAGQVFYQREERRDLMRFTAARDLNALLRYIEKKYSHPEMDQSISFKLASPKRCIKLKFDEEQTEPTTGWRIKPHLDPCQIREHEILRFGDNSTTVPPFCLVSIYAENSPHTVPNLSYSVPLKGVQEQMKIFINRSLRNLLDAPHSVGTKDVPNPGSHNDLKKHLNDLKRFLSTSELSMFRDIANGCKDIKIINSSQYNELFDGMNRQSLSERVGLFVQKITNTIEFCPDHISTFLFILREQDHVVLSTLADRIAASLDR